MKLWFVDSYNSRFVVEAPDASTAVEYVLKDVDINLLGLLVFACDTYVLDNADYPEDSGEVYYTPTVLLKLGRITKEQFNKLTPPA